MIGVCCMTKNKEKKPSIKDQTSVDRLVQTSLDLGNLNPKVNTDSFKET